MPLSRLIRASPRHSLLVPIGKRFVIVACSTGYLTPVMLTPVHLSESDSTDSEQPVRCRIHDYTLFYSDLNDLVKEQKAAGIISISSTATMCMKRSGPGSVSATGNC